MVFLPYHTINCLYNELYKSLCKGHQNGMGLKATSQRRTSCWQLIQKKPCSHPRTRLQWLRKIRLKIWRLQWIDMPPAWQASLFLKGVHWNNEVSTNQAYSSCFLFRISWILMEGLWFYFFSSPPVSAGPQKLWTLTASKIKYENFWQKILVPR